MTRILLIAAGLLSIMLAVLGLVLPLLPTTPFALLGAACFARSSPRLHRWVLRHRQFGPLLEDWGRYRAIAPRAKALALLALAATFALSLGLCAEPVILAIQVPVLMAVCWFILTRPNPPRPGVKQAAGL